VYHNNVLVITLLQGKLYHVTRADCDKQFERALLSYCSRNVKRFIKEVKTVGCDIAAYAYYTAASIAGETHFTSTSHTWCLEPWVKMCLPLPKA